MNIDKENIQSLPEEKADKEPTEAVVQVETVRKEEVSQGNETNKEEIAEAKPEGLDETLKEEAPENEGQQEKAESEQGEEEDSEDEDEAEEERIAVLDQPLVVEGKRRRATTARLELASPQVERPKKTYQGGKGVHLGSIDYVRDKVQKHKSDDLKPLHRLLYGTSKVSAKNIKKEIRAFSGFDFEEESDEAKKRRDLFNKFSGKEISDIKQTLGLIKKGDAGTGKEALINVVMPFLFAPDDHHRKVAVSKKTRKRTANAKLAPTAKRVKKAKKNEDAGESSDDEDDQEEEMNDGDEDEDERNEEGEEMEEKKKEDREETGHDASSSDDAPSPKKMVSFSDEVISPSHEQLVASCTRHVMEGKVDLENLSMKDVIEAVEAEFANADLSQRKEEIRQIVRSLLVEQ